MSVEADARAWARQQRPYRRPCGTCVWFRRNPRAARWLAAVLAERKAKRSVVATRSIVEFIQGKKANGGFDFPLSESSFQIHLAKCLGDEA